MLTWLSDGAGGGQSGHDDEPSPSETQSLLVSITFDESVHLKRQKRLLVSVVHSASHCLTETQTTDPSPSQA